MGKFDGYLICSDVDGTFSVNTVPLQKNIDAVQYFTGNGGRFSIATGRTAAYLKNTEIFKCINAPACICNGSIVYDYSAEKVLRECKEDFLLSEFLDATAPFYKKLEGLYVYYTHDTVQAKNMAGSQFDQRSLQSSPIKVVCTFSKADSAKEFKAHCLEHPTFKNTYISNSWDTGVEFNNINATKGSAVDFIKDYLPHIHTSFAIGDYENDIPMIKAADIGVCVGDGIPEAKKEADIITCNACLGAVAHLIEILENKLTNPDSGF